MALRYAVANGNWNDTATWSTTPSGAGGASVPGTGDTAYANNKAVAVNVNATCSVVKNSNGDGATAGGTFTLANGVTLTADVEGGATATCVTYAGNTPNSASIVGTILGSVGLTTGIGCVSMTGTGTLNVTAATPGGTAVWGGTPNGSSCYGLYCNGASPSVVNVVGHVRASNAISSYAIGQANTGTLNITGNIYGGTCESSRGLSCGSGCGPTNITGDIYGGRTTSSYGALTYGTVTINGNIYGGVYGQGLYSSSGTITVNGTAVGGVSTHGAHVAGATITVTRAKGGSWGRAESLSASPTTCGVSGTQTSTIYVKEIESGINGGFPVIGPVFLLPQTTSVAKFYKSDYTACVLARADIPNADHAAAGDVRSGTTYNNGSTTGTMAVPVASAVAAGVLVDAGTGTATLTADALQAVCGAAIVNTLST